MHDLIFITPIKQMTSCPAPVVFIFFNNKSESPFATRGSHHFVRCKAEVSPVMKAAGWSFYHWGDRCDRLTRPESTGCLLKVVTSLLLAPHGHSHLSGPWFSLHPISTNLALISRALSHPSSDYYTRRACVCGHGCVLYPSLAPILGFRHISFK